MPDTVVSPGPDADLVPSEPIGAEAIEAEPTREERLARLRTVFVGGLLGLALLAASYAAAEIVLPILLAFILNLVFRPVLRVLLRARLPQPVAALIIVLSLVALFGGFAMLLSGPVSGWISRLPETLPRIEQRVKVLSSPIKSLQGALQHVEGLAPIGGGGQQGAQQGAAAQGTAEGTPLARKILTQVWIVAGGAFTTLVALFFILVSGETFLRRLVEILPRFKTKRQVVDISQEIEDDLSVYLGTITMMNSVVGVATGMVAWLCGLGDPLLWGTLAFLLNYVPILGPTVGVITFFVAGLVMLDPLWMAFVPAGLYILIHVAEGETVTPMLLAHRFTVNPVLIMIGVFFWYWMWGVVGAILATPLLAITKIVCDRIEPLQPVGHFIGR
jgi:predicted PurR-regulated permease PerM